MYVVLTWTLAAFFIICFAWVVASMMQHKYMILGWSIVVACLLFGLGFSIAFIVGWVKAGTWRIKPVMIVWTIAVIAFVVLGLIRPATFTEVPHRMHDLISELSD